VAMEVAVTGVVKAVVVTVEAKVAIN